LGAFLSARARPDSECSHQEEKEQRSLAKASAARSFRGTSSAGFDLGYDGSRHAASGHQLRALTVHRGEQLFASSVNEADRPKMHYDRSAR